MGTNLVLAGVLLFLTGFAHSWNILDEIQLIDKPPKSIVRKSGADYDHSANRPPITKRDHYYNYYTINDGPEEAGVVKEFEEDQDFKATDFLGGTDGFKQYKSSESYNKDGPHQLETIKTTSFHRKSEPYSLHEFDHTHHGKEEHAEVHYHQHKHMHKHSHKQEHLHKHKQDHKHHHAHDHKHESKHKHGHKHKHDHDHKHGHKHDHKHKHDHHHGHKHKHHHGHKHKHDHHHKHGHKHNHGHKHSHKHHKH